MGGIFATLNVLGKALMGIQVAVYIISLGNLLRRKAKYRLNFVSLKNLKKEVPKIIKIIKTKIQSSN